MGTTDQLVALGPYRYVVDRPWARGDGAPPLGAVAAVEVHGDHVFVLQRQHPHVVVYDLEGRWVESLVAVDTPDGHGLSIDEDGVLWIADRDHHRVRAYTTRGELVADLGSADRPHPHGAFGHPTRAVRAEDELVVVDGYADARLLRLRRDGTVLDDRDRPGRAPGHFRTPHSVLVRRDGRVVVADRDNDRVQVFDRDGDLVGCWEDFLRPMDLFETADGQLVVTEQVPRLSLWGPDGTLIGRCRIPSTSTHGVGGDTAGNLYLAEMLQSTVTRLRLVGGP